MRFVVVSVSGSGEPARGVAVRPFGSGEPARGVAVRRSGSGEPAAPRRQSLLRSQARCALLPAATPRVRAEPHLCGVAYLHPRAKDLGFVGRVDRQEVTARTASRSTSPSVKRSHPQASWRVSLGPSEGLIPTALSQAPLGTSQDLIPTASWQAPLGPSEGLIPTASWQAPLGPSQGQTQAALWPIPRQPLRGLGDTALSSAVYRRATPQRCGSARTRGVAAGRSAQRACERSSDWRRGAAGSPDPKGRTATPRAGSPDPKGRTATPRAGSPDPERRTATPRAGCPDRKKHTSTGRQV